jgi:hypothetical protein
VGWPHPVGTAAISPGTRPEDVADEVDRRLVMVSPSEFATYMVLPSAAMAGAPGEETRVGSPGQSSVTGGELAELGLAIAAERDVEPGRGPGRGQQTAAGHRHGRTG